MIVAIHQPNYLPWLGYFHKIAAADLFIFLDDAQFSKNSFINRVKVLGADGARWLTVPVSYRFGDPINRVRPARGDWAAAHLDSLRNFYGVAPFFREVFPRLSEIFGASPRGDIAVINRFLVESIADELGLTCKFRSSSEFSTSSKADDHLVELVSAVSSGAIYLSGKGGAKYQNPEKFAAAGLGFRYTDFKHPSYEQGGQEFVAGLSILDPLFHLGWPGTAALIQSQVEES